MQIKSVKVKFPKLMAILSPTEKMESEVDDPKELQPLVLKVAELKYEKADPKITIELPDPQSSKVTR